MRVVSAALPVRVRTPRGARWWLREEALAEVAAQATEGALAGPGPLPGHLRVIKGTDRKTVFRVRHAGRAFVAKVFHLNPIRHRLKYHRFGLDEAANLLTASGRGLNVPRVEGYGQVRGGIGLVRKSIVLLQDLEGFVSVRELLEQCGGDEDACARILLGTAALFPDLYRTRCHHIDVNGGAVMVREDGRDDGEVFLLDFQHARFLDAPSTEVLMAEAGRFAGSFGNLVTGDAVSRWLDEIFERTGILPEEERRTLRDRFRYYRDSGLSRKERKGIGGGKR